MGKFIPQSDKAAGVLQGVVRAIQYAEQDVSNLQAAGDWLCLIEAATTQAYYLLTGDNDPLTQLPSKRG